MVATDPATWPAPRNTGHEGRIDVTVPDATQACFTETIVSPNRSEICGGSLR
jgi:hypothetical protein